MKKMSLYQMLGAMIGDITSLRLGTFVASTSFFFYLSLIPSLILLCTIIPYTPLDMEYVLSYIQMIAPASIQPLLSTIVKQIYFRSAGRLTISAIATLWTAGMGTNELVSALSTIRGYKEKQNYLFSRLRSSLYTLFIIFFMIFSLVILIFGKKLLSYLLIVPQLEEFYHGIKSLLNLHYIFVFIALVFLFTILYAKAPGKKTTFRHSLPGAILSACAWLLFTYLFSLYIQIFNPFTAYGSLTTTVITLIWIYACMYCIFIGALVNKHLPHFFPIFGPRE